MRGRYLSLGLACLVVGLLAASPATAAHPAAVFSSGAAEPGASSPALPPAEIPAPATPTTAALICLAVLALPGVLAARGPRRVATVAAAALLVWFAGATAIHSVHHLTDRADAEACPVFAAAQHVPGLDPEPGGPGLERPMATAMVLLASPVAAGPIVLDGEHARAPPAVPA